MVATAASMQAPHTHVMADAVTLISPLHPRAPAHPQITTAVDTYAFGILLWELYTGRAAYGGLARDSVIAGVCRRDLRPRFPPAAPPAWARLAEACWTGEPGGRPAFDKVCAELLEWQRGALGG